MDANVWEHLRKLFAKHCKTGDFTLSSGRKSDFYINLRAPLALGQLNLSELGCNINSFLEQTNANVYAGPAAAAISLMTAALMSYSGPIIEDRALKMCYTRASKKAHGLKNQVEGPLLTEKDRVILIDDVLTSGKSLIECSEALLETYPCQIVGVWIVVDRCEGGKKALKERFPEMMGVTSVFRKEHLLEIMD